MPHLIKRLFHVQKYADCVNLVLKAIRDVLYKAMDLLGATMRLPETELVLWDVFCCLRQFHQAGKQNSLKNFGESW